MSERQLREYRIFTMVLFILLFSGCFCFGGDWPAFGGDSQRSCVSGEELKLPLGLSWEFVSGQKPQAAWPEPAGQDYWHRISKLSPEVVFDRAFGVVSVGGRVYFGCSADDKVYCLDGRTGEVRWSFFCEGPVRLAPTVVDGRVYVGSDDGAVYCLGADDGKVLWKYRAAEKDYRLAGNQRIISIGCVRTGVIVEDGVCYFCSGIFPEQEVWLCAVKAVDGSEVWKQQIKISPQGYMLASGDKLFVPTGRTGPSVFSKIDGSFVGTVNSEGGSFAMVKDDILINAPGRGSGAVSFSSVSDQSRVAVFDGLAMVLEGDMAYMLSHTEISAMNRTRYIQLLGELNKLKEKYNGLEKELKETDKNSSEGQAQKKAALLAEIEQLKVQSGKIQKQMEECTIWRQAGAYPYSMILAGGVLFAGGNGEVAGFDVSNGEQVWKGSVEGKVYSLGIAGGKLLVSTDEGRVYSFGSGDKQGGKVVKVTYNDGGLGRFSGLKGGVERLIKKAGARKGYCLVVGNGDGKLVYEIAKQTEMQIVALQTDVNNVDAVRQRLDKAGLYGRAVVYPFEGNLSFAKYLFNLVIVDGVAVGEFEGLSSEKIFEIVRPCGGAAFVGEFGSGEKVKSADLRRWAGDNKNGWEILSENGLWAFVERGALEGSGEWTHQYAEPGNSSCSKDELVKLPVAVQWFGRPGPKDMIDRHHRNVPPLYKDGRLFVPGDSVVFGVDAYNGTVEWRTEVPNSRRLGVFLDSSNLVVDDTLLYVAAEDKCYGFDVETGKQSLVYDLPRTAGKDEMEWGYIASDGDMLFGSGCKADASYTGTSWECDNELWYRNMKVVTSPFVFGMNKNSSKKVWSYEEGLILNNTITVSSGKVYFVETTSPEALSDTVGRMPIVKLFSGGEQYLTALDAKSGETIYRKRLDVSKIKEPVFLNYSKGYLIFNGSNLVDGNIIYYVYAFDAENGELRWEVNHNSELAADGGHGEYNRHPTIISDTVYAWPYAYKLSTGEKVEGWKFNRRGHGCGGVSASAQCMFWRGHNPWMYDLGEDIAYRLNTVTRPGCWINMIPAGGLLLIPEASSGCTCGYSLQTSIAYVPVN